MASDQNLIEQCLNGDQSAFDGIVLRYQDALYRHLLRLAGNAEQAEDLCQEAFIRFYKSLSRFDRNRAIAPFLFKIATNLWRDGKRNPFLVEPEEGALALEQAHVEDQTIERLERQAIKDALDRLRPEYREIVSLRYDQGLSYREISEVIGVPSGTVATWLKRAVETLRLILTESHTKEVVG